jgi:hypothetical protein
MRVASLFISACLFLFQAAVQTATPVQRDPQAVALLQTSVKAMGGTAPIDSLATGDIVTVAGSLNSTGTIRILTRGTDQTSEQIQTASSFTRVYSRGRASITAGGSLSTLPMESAVTTQSSCFPLPFLSAALANPDTAFKYIGLETLNGSSVQHIQFWNTFASIPDLQPLANLSHRDIWVDATSGLPQRVSFASRSSDGSGSSVPVDVLLSDYRNTNGILYPFSIQVSVNGTPWATISIQNVTLNSGLDDSSFLVQQGEQQ